VNHKERRNGLENWRSIVDELGAVLEDTTMVDTPSGGMHLWYRVTSHSIASGNAALAPGIDVKAAGGYVVAPPSIIAGKPYTFRDGHGFDRLADLPPALADLLANPQSEPRRGNRDAPQPESVILEGARNATLASLAGAMRRKAMSEAAMLAALLEDNARRCRPPLGEREVRRIAASVARYAPYEVPTAPAVAAGSPRLPITSVRDLAKREPETAPAVIPGYLYVNSISDLTAHPKMGKTTLLVAMAGAVATGKSFLELDVRRGAVLYLSEENHSTLLSAVRRIGAEEAAELYVIFRRDAYGLSWPEICAQVKQFCLELGVVLVVVDTLSDWAGLRGDEENSAGAALQAIQPLRDLAGLPNLSIVVARHERKSGGAIGRSARGSSQFTGAVDVVLLLRDSNAKNRRTLEAISRFDDTPEAVTMELVEGEFKSLGGTEGIRDAEQEREILELVPFGFEHAVTADDVAAKTKWSVATVRRRLAELVRRGRVLEQVGAVPGRQVTAVGYWRPTEEEAEGQ
jgi:hypothetical protein